MTTPAKAPPQRQYVLKDGKVHQIVHTPAGQVLAGPVNLENWSSQVRLNFPRIPYDLFLQICHWQQNIVNLHTCESSCSLFLLTREDGTKYWEAVPFYQKNTQGSYAIDTEFAKDPRNDQMLGEYAERSPMHGTLHNHVHAPAGQSTADYNDEMGLYGPHITIGNLNLKKMTFHARLSIMVGAKHHFIPLHFCDIIDVPVPPDADLAALNKLADVYLETSRLYAPDYPDEWEDRFEFQEKKTYWQQQQSQTHLPNGQAKAASSSNASANSANATAAGERKAIGMGGITQAEWDAMMEEAATINEDEDPTKKNGESVKVAGNGVGAVNLETITKLTEAVDKIGKWPTDIINSLPLVSYASFLARINQLTPIGQEAVIAVCTQMKITYRDLFNKLCELQKAVDDNREKA